MGVSIYAKNSKYSFDMGYGGFFNLRKNIAFALDKEFGENYEKLGSCFFKRDFEENDKIANRIIRKKNLDADVINFLYQCDCEGKISSQTCKKIYDLIKNVDFGNRGFRYAMYQNNDYEEFKEFLKECYRHCRKMRWN